MWLIVTIPSLTEKKSKTNKQKNTGQLQNKNKNLEQKKPPFPQENSWLESFRHYIFVN